MFTPFGPIGGYGASSFPVSSRLYVGKINKKKKIYTLPKKIGVIHFEEVEDNGREVFFTNVSYEINVPDNLPIVSGKVEDRRQLSKGKVKRLIVTDIFFLNFKSDAEETLFTLVFDEDGRCLEKCYGKIM
jgi:hypothetical protein